MCTKKNWTSKHIFKKMLIIYVKNVKPVLKNVLDV